MTGLAQVFFLAVVARGGAGFAGAAFAGDLAFGRSFFAVAGGIGTEGLDSFFSSFLIASDAPFAGLNEAKSVRQLAKSDSTRRN